MSRYKPNPNLARMLVRTPQMIETLKVRAEEVADAVREIAPVGKSKPGEHYVDQIEAVAGLENGQATGRVNANKFTAGFLEFGTIHNRPFAILRRALESLGLSVHGRRG